MGLVPPTVGQSSHMNEHDQANPPTGMLRGLSLIDSRFCQVDRGKYF